jgi:hypothetical protein
MKDMTLKNNPRPLWDLTKEVAPGFIRLTSRGKLVAYLLLASRYDEEDIDTMTDPAFWKMIRERQKGPWIPWEQVKAELFNGKRPRRPGASADKSNGRRKERKNGSLRSK